MQDQLNQLQSQVTALQQQLDMMRSSGSFPYDVQQAIEDRLQPITLSPSTKTTASATQAVDEAGIATYDVATPMDGFEQRTVDGVVRNYPYYL